MEKLNRDLKQKLDRLPDDVRELAVEALSNAERLPDAPLSQYLEQMVRKIVRDSDTTPSDGGVQA